MIFHITKPEWKQKSTEINYINPNDLNKVLTYLDSKERLGYDSETTGFDKHTDKLFSYQIGTDEHQFVIDHRVVPITAFKDIIENKTIVGVNLKFDLGFLYVQDIYPTKVIDCMLNEVVLTSGLYTPVYIKANKPYSFLTLSKKYLNDEEVDKSIGASFSVKPYDEPLYAKEIIYAAKDVVNPLLILEAQQADIDLKNVRGVVDLENEFVKALASMEYNGIHLDRSIWKKIKKDVNEQLVTAEKKLNDELYASPIGKKSLRTGGKSVPLFYEYETLDGTNKIIPAVKWSSSDQVKQVFNLLNIDVESVGKDKLTKLKGKYPFIQSYLDYKSLDSLKIKFSDVLEEFINPVTDNIHPDFWQIVQTGRLSCNRPNLQQIPSKGDFGKRMRHSFVATEGNTLVTSDISGAELRIVTELSQEPAWIEIFNEGKDLHSVTAAKTFKIPIEEVLDPFPVKPEMTYRYVTKTVGFGLIYGMSEYKLSDTISVSVEDAKDIMADYFSAVPKLKKYLDKSKSFVKKNLVAYSMYDRPRFFPEPYGTKQEINKVLSSYERMGSNHPIQSTNADWVKLAICDIFKEIRNGFPAKLRLTVHDEIVCEVPEHLGDEWKERQEGIMIKAGQKFIKSIPIVVESNVGKYWSH